MIAHCLPDGKRNVQTTSRTTGGPSLNSQMNVTQNAQSSTFRRSPWFLPVLFAPVFMVIADVFIVNVAAPSLHKDIGATDSDLQWVVAAYLLTYALSLITGGRLGDVFGQRRMFMLGIVGFTAASALCA